MIHHDRGKSVISPQLYHQATTAGSIPEQWKISKIIPIHKSGNKDEIENYRPIANLCSTSKVFEKLILNQIHYLEKTNKLDLTGKNQHGFKKTKSTATAGALLQYTGHEPESHETVLRLLVHALNLQL